MSRFCHRLMVRRECECGWTEDRHDLVTNCFCLFDALMTDEYVHGHLL